MNDSAENTREAQSLLEDDIFNTEVFSRSPQSDDEEETTGGLGSLGRQRTRESQRLIATKITSNKPDGGSESSGWLAAMGISTLVAAYAAYAAAYAKRIEQGQRDAGLIHKLAGIRAELQKRCIIDVLLPLLGHINPLVQITAAIDLLCTAFEHGDRAVKVLKVMNGGGRGFVSFLAGFALDTYFHAQLTPLPSKILSEATRVYSEIPRSIKDFNQNLLENRSLPTPDKIVSWDGHDHTGRFITIAGAGPGDKYYVQHVGMNEYQVYNSDRLTQTPISGERYRVRRDGSLQRDMEQGRSLHYGRARGKS